MADTVLHAASVPVDDVAKSGDLPRAVAANASARMRRREAPVSAAARATSASSAEKFPVAGAALMAGDAAAFALAAIVLTPLGAVSGNAAALVSLVSAAVIVLCWSDGLYPGYGVYPHELLKRRANAFAKVTAFAFVGGIVLSDWKTSFVLVAFLAMSFCLQLVMAPLTRKLLGRLGRWGVCAEIIASEEQAKALKEFFAANWHLGIRCGNDGCTAHETGATIALVAASPAGWEDVVRARLGHSEVIALAGIPGTDASGLRPADLRGEIGLRLRTAPAAVSGRLGRMFDLAIAGSVLLCSAPLLILAAAAIYVVDPGPMIYRQTREGLGGRQFRILKLRTMYRDADERLEALLASDESARAEWSRHYKLRHDPRILPVIGRALRVTSADELPQLINVLAGDMRIVGPRPFPLYHLEAMNREFRLRRRTVMPGVTGLWQATARSTADLQRQQALDSFYIDNRSFWFDVHIVLLTAVAIFRGDGAY